MVTGIEGSEGGVVVVDHPLGPCKGVSGSCGERMASEAEHHLQDTTP